MFAVVIVFEMFKQSKKFKELVVRKAERRAPRPISPPRSGEAAYQGALDRYFLLLSVKDCSFNSHKLDADLHSCELEAKITS